MTRPIKFRAWTGQMQYDIMVGRFGIFYVNPGEKGDGLDVKDTASLTPFTTKIDEKYCQIMQFTGLLDKNGKEIYEGDFVKGQYKTYIVTCEGAAFRLRTEDKSSPDCLPILENTSRIEVIGNIYENPDLLSKN